MYEGFACIIRARPRRGMRDLGGAILHAEVPGGSAAALSARRTLIPGRAAEAIAGLEVQYRLQVGLEVHAG
jgi:hypothetical protein